MTPIAEKTDAAYLLTLPRAERNRILALAAEAAAPEYEADLVRPVAERELTTFTALDGEPFLGDTVDADDPYRAEMTEAEVQARLEIVQSIAALATLHGEPDFSGRDHDLILYGGPDGA